ncbi:hypothetical protein SAMN05878503_10949 [Cereibacter ovatus]|uniref:Transposase n=1 Tax=Cereibacter ovatus TaxID=439529 RepID=A0A285CUI3_9RHOB|nr:hypothetical protein [Cereibacter ovatus]SNX71249.1 hypothetical protein SAMN05878503_10949 [Cereibacter ovatus]
MAGGTDFKWCGKPGVKPLGVCYHLGIDITFALPANGQSKIAGRPFATLSSVIDDRPEFRGAHAEHAPGATPTPNVVPVPFAVAEAVIRRKIDRHNREGDRRSQGMRGRSYKQMFSAGQKHWIMRKPMVQKHYFSGLIYKPASVDR